VKSPRIYDRKGVLAVHPRAFFDFFFEPLNRENESTNDVAIVSIRGPLEHHAGWWCDSYDAILDRVDLALAGPAKALVLRIDSPGGECAGCFEAARAIREKCAAAGKRVYSYVDGNAFSAAYALACAGEQVVLGESSLCGSVGVIAQRLDVSARNQAIGLRV
jgi:ClpP class serine protease